MYLYCLSTHQVLSDGSGDSVPSGTLRVLFGTAPERKVRLRNAARRCRHGGSAICHLSSQRVGSDQNTALPCKQDHVNFRARSFTAACSLLGCGVDNRDILTHPTLDSVDFDRTSRHPGPDGAPRGIVCTDVFGLYGYM